MAEAGTADGHGVRMRYGSLIAVVLVVGSSCQEGATVPDVFDDPLPEPWQEFSVGQMRSQQAQQNASYFQAHADSSFRMGLVHVPAATGSGLLLHQDNALYYVVEGSGVIAIGGSDYAFETGALLLVRGDMEHAFRLLDSDMRAVVMFPRGLSDNSDPEFVAFTAEDVAAVSDPTDNVFTQLFDNSTMTVGVYALPKGATDDVLVHGFNEFKMILTGGARFEIGGGGIEAMPGAIAYIGEGARHQFRRISDDLSVLVVWNP
jgi:mannose-6-phosphate isomerase-like protein (cupin superfamily)